MMEDPLDPRLRDAVAEYNKPPETPREEMWAAIAATRGARQARRPVWRTLIWGGLAAAAVLVLGILIGRGLSVTPLTPTGPGSATANPAPASQDNGFKVAAVQYLSQTEVFLTTFRTDLKQGTLDQSAGRRAQELLSANRLLMDSPAANDPKTKALLQDLELVLAEIAQMTDQTDRTEANMIDDGLEQGGLLPRLRTAVPAGQPTVGL